MESEKIESETRERKNIFKRNRKKGEERKKELKSNEGSKGVNK